jgi:hypothetical protein
MHASRGSLGACGLSLVVLVILGLIAHGVLTLFYSPVGW